LIVSRALTQQATQRASNNKDVDFHVGSRKVTPTQGP
jgi:hypothetical protein